MVRNLPNRRLHRNQSPMLPLQCKESDSNLKSIIKPFGWLQAPAITQIDRMQTKAGNRKRFAEWKAFSR
jgi:hypothetical protein